ncbi:hypothetical protein PVMG_04851 [Plasmodium vivax Mauritania I]|uniref:PIR protein n=1 Tax=Plasmodium vivax Mauritania I TaxID=1035515 RepID=A0A0J9T7K8_PLAVI|nr:hypothetical protein PVMG_04851 [Plasmodium vivax Mauritania I]
MDKDSIYKALKDLDSGTGAKLVSQSTSYIECNDTINNEQARSICLIFNSLLEKLCSIKSTETNSTLNEGDCKYLNYWLNVQLNSSKLNTSEIISGIFKKLNIKNKNCFKKETMIEKLSHIKKEDIQEMEILNNLYAIYSELNEIFFSSKGNQNSTCLNISNKCSDQYELAIKSCRKQNSDCYKALQNFKTTYELLTTTPVTGNACSSSDIKLFRPAEEILKENSLVTNVEQNRSSSVTPILVSTLGLSFSLIFLYMVRKLH